MDSNLQNNLQIPLSHLQDINSMLLDPQMQVINDFLDVVKKYGTPEEINQKHYESRMLSHLFKKIREKKPEYINDLEWLIKQKEAGSFISIKDYRTKICGRNAEKISFAADSAVTLEVSALQYFPWVPPMLEQAIKNRSLVPARFIAVRKMKEAEEDGDLPALVAAMDIIGASFVETLDTKGTDGSNIHLNGPDTITGYFGGIGQPNEHALRWIDEYLYYYTNYGVQHVLNFNAGTILLGFLLYKLGVDIKFKISVFFGSDNPYHALWIMAAAKLFCRNDGTSPLAGFNWANSINNSTIEISSQFRKSLGFEDVIRFEHHITETWKSIVKQPYNRRSELISIAGKVKNIAAKHEGGESEIDSSRIHPSDILDYFRNKEEIIANGDWDALYTNFMDKIEASNLTAQELTKHHLAFIAAKNLHT